MDIEKRIQDLNADDLKRLLSALNFSLSGSTIGEAGAFELLAEIESIAIKENDAREEQQSRYNANLRSKTGK